MGQPHNSPFDEVLQIQVDYLKRSKITSKHIRAIITWKDKGNPMSKDSTWNNKHVAKVIIKGCLEGFNRHSFFKVWGHVSFACEQQVATLVSPIGLWIVVGMVKLSWPWGRWRTSSSKTLDQSSSSSSIPCQWASLLIRFRV